MSQSVSSSSADDLKPSNSHCKIVTLSSRKLLGSALSFSMLVSGIIGGYECRGLLSIVDFSKQEEYPSNHFADDGYKDQYRRSLGAIMVLFILCPVSLFNFCYGIFSLASPALNNKQSSSYWHIIGPFVRDSTSSAKVRTEGLQDNKNSVHQGLFSLKMIFGMVLSLLLLLIGLVGIVLSLGLWLLFFQMLQKLVTGGDSDLEGSDPNLSLLMNGGCALFSSFISCMDVWHGFKTISSCCLAGTLETNLRRDLLLILISIPYVLCIASILGCAFYLFMFAALTFMI
mgnify:CR=1 FL=1